MEKNKSKRRNIIGNILFFISGVVLTCGVFFGIKGLVNDYQEYKEVVDEQDDLTDIFYHSVPSPNEQSGKDLSVPDDEAWELQQRYANMKAINSDYACWLKINGTGQEYPVCINPTETSYYYLNHSFKKRYSGAGCLFIDPASSVDCDNLIIYGHHMRNGTMFGSLGKFLKETWARDNKIIEVFTETEHRYYEVVCVFSASIYKMPFGLNSYTDLSDYNTSCEYGRLLRKVTQVDMDWVSGEDGFELSPTVFTPGVYKDRFLTLITCEYTHKNGREVVIARELNRPEWTMEERTAALMPEATEPVA